MLGIVCGLASEAAIAGKVPGVKIACSGAVPDEARRLTRELISQGVTHLMSFGVAGGLDSRLRVGSLVVGDRIVTKDKTWDCDLAWNEQIAKHLPQATRGHVWGSEILVATAAGKTGLYKDYGCAIVDMESHCMAETAHEAGVPFTVLRVVCDRASHNVPDLVMKAIKPDGGTDFGAVFTGLKENPRDVADLIGVGYSMWLATRRLGAATRALLLPIADIA